MTVGHVGGRLYRRCCRIKMNGFVVAEHLGGEEPGHRIAFSAVKHNRVEPNEADVQIYGLSEEKRNRILSAFERAREKVRLQRLPGGVEDLEIEAGYDGVMSTIFRGDITRIRHHYMDPSWMTEVEARDGVLPFNSTVHQSFVGPVSMELVMKVLQDASGLAMDRHSEKEFLTALKDWKKTEVKGGYVLSGDVHKHITELCETLKLAWTVQDGKMVLLRYDQVTTDEAVLLTPQTGLTKRLEHGEWGRGYAESRLNPLLHPGRQVRIEDSEGTPDGAGRVQGAGWFRVDQAEHQGDTDTGHWVTRLTLSHSAPLLRQPSFS